MLFQSVNKMPFKLCYVCMYVMQVRWLIVGLYHNHGRVNDDKTWTLWHALYALVVDRSILNLSDRRLKEMGDRSNKLSKKYKRLTKQSIADVDEALVLHESEILTMCLKIKASHLAEFGLCGKMASQSRSLDCAKLMEHLVLRHRHDQYGPSNWENKCLDIDVAIGSKPNANTESVTPQSSLAMIPTSTPTADERADDHVTFEDSHDEESVTGTHAPVAATLFPVEVRRSTRKHTTPKRFISTSMTRSKGTTKGNKGKGGKKKNSKAKTKTDKPKRQCNWYGILLFDC